MIRTKCLLTACLIVGTFGIATADVFEDRFSDDDAAGLWRLNNDHVKVRERGSKMRFRSESADNDDRTAESSALGWSFDCSRSFDLSFRYKIRAHAYDDDWAAVGTRIELDDDDVEMIVCVVQDVEGRWLVLESWADDVLLDEVSVPIDEKVGTVAIDYGSGNDRLKVRLNGDRLIRIDDFMNGLGVDGDDDARVSMFGGRDGVVEWDEDDVWIDDLSFDGRIDEDDDSDADDDSDDDSDDDADDDSDDDSDDDDDDDSDDDSDDDDDDDSDDDDDDDDDSDSDDDNS